MLQEITFNTQIDKQVSLIPPLFGQATFITVEIVEIYWPCHFLINQCHIVIYLAFS